MALPRARSAPPTALTASGARVRQVDQPDLMRLQQPGQLAALSYYDALGEVRVGAHFYSRMLQRLRIYPGRRISDDRIEPVTTGAPVDLLNRIQDPGGGRTAILKNYGRLMFLTGEGYLFGVGMDDGREHWSFVWRDELKFDGAGNVTHMLAPAVPRGNYHLVEDSDFIALPEGSAVAYRLWTPHPRASAIPDSPMLSTLDIARELLLLTSSVHATATSRLVRSKLLLMPQEISPGPIGMPGRSDDPLIDPFQRDLADHFDRALENPSEAASLSPYIIWAMSDYLKEIRDLTLHDTATDYLERDLRSETIKRLALGWDMPPEALMGLGGTNHWSAWAVREDMWVLHGAPIAEQFCDDIGEAYLRPALREEGYDGWEEVVVAYDETGVIVNPDRSKDADEAWDRGAISYAAYRNAKRFKETDEPPEEEYLNWLAIKLRDAAVSPDAAEEVGPGDVQAGPPPGEPGPVSEQTNLPEEAALWGAAQLAVLRCREMAGNRLRSRRDSCPECLEEMTEIPNTDLAATLSREAWAKLGMVDPAALVRGGADSFRLLALGWGMDEPSVTSLVARIEDHAARTLFDQKPSLLERA